MPVGERIQVGTTIDMWLRTVLTLSKLRSVFCASSSYGSRMSTSVKWYFDMVESSASWNESSSSSEDVCLHSLTAGSSEGTTLFMVLADDKVERAGRRDEGGALRQHPGDCGFISF